MKVLKYFTVTRQLIDQRGRNKREQEIKDMLDEVLSMALVDNMVLKSYFVHGHRLYITFEQFVRGQEFDDNIIDSMLSPEQKKWRRSEFNDHKLHSCKNVDCFTCDQGLADCIVCGGAEGSLPTDCPGLKMSAEARQGVYDKKLDFVKGKWVRVHGQRKEKTLQNKSRKKSRKA